MTKKQILLLPCSSLVVKALLPQFCVGALKITDEPVTTVVRFIMIDDVKYDLYELMDALYDLIDCDGWSSYMVNLTDEMEKLLLKTGAANRSIRLSLYRGPNRAAFSKAVCEAEKEFCRDD